LAQADSAFAPSGGLINAELDQRLQQTVASFLDLAEAAMEYPRLKAQW
jgi:hypothetical protein